MAQERDSKERFSGRAEDYARYRPHYPKETAAAILREFDLRAPALVADVGCGTGISSEPFLEAGCRVIGIEPNSDMRAAAKQWLEGESRFEAMDGSAENTGLESGSIDLYLAGQAFHWFNITQARAEAIRILKPPRRAVLMWNDRLASASPFMRDFSAFLDECHKSAGTARRSDPDGGDYDEFFGAGRWKTLKIAHEREMTEEVLVGGVFSASYSPNRGGDGADAVAEEAKMIFVRHASGGKVRMEYETSLYFGEISDY